MTISKHLNSRGGLLAIAACALAIAAPALAGNLTGPDVVVTTEAAQEMTLRLAREDGLFVSPSSGAAAVGALRVASRLTSGVVVTVFADAGYKHISEFERW